MKCYEVTRCSEQERVNCYVWKNFGQNVEDMENLKCWVLKGVYHEENREQAKKCQKCTYFLAMNTEAGIASDYDADLAIVSCSGTINSQKTWALEKVWDALKKNSKFKVLLDIGNVNNIYSCGLSMFVKINKEILAAGGKFVIAGARTNVLQIFTATKLEKILTLVADRQSAKALFESERRLREQAEQIKQQQKELAAEAAKPKPPPVPKKRIPCWEYFKNHNPKNATRCDECFQKLSTTGTPCWIVEGMIEGVSFQYVNEECAGCGYYAEYGGSQGAH